jgi:hypothetical protein
MKRHAVDLIALLAGVAFALTAGGFLVYELSDTRVDGVWVVALGLMFLGAVALAATFLSQSPPAEVQQPASERELSDATP